MDRSPSPGIDEVLRPNDKEEFETLSESDSMETDDYSKDIFFSETDSDLVIDVCYEHLHILAGIDKSCYHIMKISKR